MCCISHEIDLTKLEKRGAPPLYACYEEAKKPPETWQVSDPRDRFALHQRKEHIMSPTVAQAYALSHLGFSAIQDDSPAIQCSFSPLETFSSVDWDSLVSHATNYQLCDCHLHG